MQDEHQYAQTAASREPAASAGKQADPVGNDYTSASNKAGGGGGPGTGNFVLRELVQVLFPALLLALTIHLFLAQATIVYGRSMEPNLQERQRLIVDKFTYRFLHSPHRNDIVVIKLPDMDDLLVKRIVGLPYETIEITNGIVYIDGKPLDEPFPHGTYLQTMGPRRLGPLEYFVLGDNRGNSNDSRAFGPIMREDIKGRVWFRYWPINQLHTF
ncbi:MAG TPA: signal peptidase I [Caldilineaceae bacterium]|nr:signal peptidase I [Caldilineaceae bacterium]